LQNIANRKTALPQKTLSFGAAIVDVDLHGCTLPQAKGRIDAALRNASADCYKLRIIHGHRKGTALRDMVRSQYSRNPKVLRVESSVNQGETLLCLRDMY